MRIKPGETLESWAERVRKHEYNNALARIAKGEDTNEVMERMSRSIQKKLLHPLYDILRVNRTDFDAEVSRKRYEESMRNRTPVADQIEDKLFDNSD